MSGIASSGSAETVQFRIHDHRDSVEIDEVTLVYIDGRQIGSFRLGPDHEEDVMIVEVEGGADHRYALCGRVTIRREDGSTITREVNGAGTLSDVADRDFDAVAANDFTIFYLREITTSREPAQIVQDTTRACMPNVASR